MRDLRASRIRPRAALLGLSFVFAMAYVPGSAAAQFDPSSLEGLRVRITARAILDDPIVGEVLRVLEDSLVVARSATVDRVAGPIRIPFDAIERLELSDGTRPNRPRGAAIGGGIGLAAATLLIVANGPRDMPGAVLVGGAGVVGGGLIGLLAAGAIQSERWTELPRQLWTTSALGAGGGVSLSLGPDGGIMVAARLSR